MKWRAVLCSIFAPALAAGADCKPQAPCYEATGIVNAASYEAGALAPYTFATIFGENLAYNTVSRPGDRAEFSLGGVTVTVNDISAVVFYVSPKQVNFLVPSALLPANASFRLLREGVFGPGVSVRLTEYAPALFTLDRDTALSIRHPDWSIVSSEAPARPGDILILYATGLGRMTLPVDDTAPARSANAIKARNEFRLLLDGVPLENEGVLYVGAAPLFSGVYQINFRVPDRSLNNPEIRIAIADRLSPAGLRVPIQ